MEKVNVMSLRKYSIESTETADTYIPYEERKRKKKGVTFKENFVEIIDVECWSSYNDDFSKKPYLAWGPDKELIIDTKKESKKEKRQKNICGEGCIII